MTRTLLPAVILLAACQRTHTVGTDDIDGIAEGGGSGDVDEDDGDEDDGGSGSSGGGSSGSGSSGSSSGSASTGGSSGSGSGTDDCWATLTPVSPTVGQTDHYYRSAIEIDIYAGDGSEQVSVWSVDGWEVEGALTNDGQTLAFAPLEPLEPSTGYTVLIEYCDGEVAEYGFSTSDLGASLVGCEPTTTHYVLDIDSARFIDPAGVGDLIAGQLDGEALLSLSDPDGSPQLVFGYGDGTEPETCGTAAGLEATWTSPHVDAAGDLPLLVEGETFTLYGATLSGAFSSDCERFGGGELTGRFDMRQVAPELGDLLGITDPDEVCATLTGFGVSCEACPDGQTYCVDARVDQITGESRGSAQAPRTEAEVLALPECEEVGGGCSTAPGDRALGLAGLALLGLVVTRRRTRR